MLSPIFKDNITSAHSAVENFAEKNDPVKNCSVPNVKKTGGETTTTRRR